MLKTRIITAVLLIALIVIILKWGGTVGWAAFVLLVMTLGLWEWANFAQLKQEIRIPAAVAGGVALGALGVFNQQAQLPQVLFLISASFWLLVVPGILKNVGATWLSRPALHFLLALVLLAAAGAAMLSARAHGVVFLFSLLALVWVADIGAYFVGKTIGKRKLAPRISPGKSWEGAIGGAVLVVAYGWIWVFLGQKHEALADNWATALYTQWNPYIFSGCMLVLAGLSVTGDLFESLLKRRVGLKDSSQLLPGHGGVLDRIDAQLPVLPLAMLMLGLQA